ncbi:MAG: SRPBCC family protein [Alphaproteobacteria bacterium]|nr:SRPBCC family protein [Alphaproteobacteria bacterium]
MLRRILVGIAAVVIALAIIISLRPSELRVARSASIAAAPSAVFAQVNDFRKWSAWSPYERVDPAMKKTYAGASAGMGAINAWAGNSEAGEGRATIVESRPNELVKIQLDFLKPMEGNAVAEFSFRPEGERTQVTWSFVGPCNFIAKAVGLFLDMDKMVGGQFEEGLADLKKTVETTAKS